DLNESVSGMSSFRTAWQHPTTTARLSLEAARLVECPFSIEIDGLERRQLETTLAAPRVWSRDRTDYWSLRPLMLSTVIVLPSTLPTTLTFRPRNGVIFLIDAALNFRILLSSVTKTASEPSSFTHFLTHDSKADGWIHSAAVFFAAPEVAHF